MLVANVSNEVLGGTVSTLPQSLGCVLSIAIAVNWEETSSQFPFFPMARLPTARPTSHVSRDDDITKSITPLRFVWKYLSYATDDRQRKQQQDCGPASVTTASRPNGVNCDVQRPVQCKVARYAPNPAESVMRRPCVGPHPGGFHSNVSRRCATTCSKQQDPYMESYNGQYDLQGGTIPLPEVEVNRRCSKMILAREFAS